MRTKLLGREHIKRLNRHSQQHLGRFLKSPTRNKKNRRYITAIMIKLRVRSYHRSYFFIKFASFCLSRQPAKNKQSNKENHYRKTSQEYFRKLSQDKVIMNHSHGRKVSWKEQLDDVRIFYTNDAPNEYQDI